MYLECYNSLEESMIALTDFNDATSQHLAIKEAYYKIFFAKDSKQDIVVDGCNFELKKNEVLFCTPLNHVQIPLEGERLLSVIFNREFYCIEDNDTEVSCNGFLFYGSSSPVVLSLDAEQCKLYSNIDCFRFSFMKKLLPKYFDSEWSYA